MKFIWFFLFFFSSYLASAQTLSLSRVDMGRISAKSVTTIYIVNDSGQNMVVTRVEADCRCTKAQFSRRPVAVGDSVALTLSYIPTGDKGVFYKTVRIFTSSKNEPLELNLRGVTI